MVYSLIATIIILALGLVAICYRLTHIVQQNNRFLMVEKNIAAYEQTYKSQSERDLENRERKKVAKELADGNEWMNAQFSDSVTKEQQEKFGVEVDDVV